MDQMLHDLRKKTYMCKCKHVLLLLLFSSIHSNICYYSCLHGVVWVASLPKCVRGFFKQNEEKFNFWTFFENILNHNANNGIYLNKEETVFQLNLMNDGSKESQGVDIYGTSSPESYGWFLVSMEVHIYISESTQRRCMRGKILNLE